jgi:tRNA (cmo5U34)-methyltransferase
MNEQSGGHASAIFDREMAESYDTRNSSLAPISENMHFLVRLVLEDLPKDASILCVGVGTGAEILSLARDNPGWRFVAVDPSAEMLEVCRKKLIEEELLDRCDLIHGYVTDSPSGPGFHAALSILVAHFVPREERAQFYRDIHDRLMPGGRFISTEICFDLDSPEFPDMLRNWKRIQIRAGASRESLEKLPDMLRNTLCVLGPEETMQALESTGFNSTLQFFQAFMISGFQAVR